MFSKEIFNKIKDNLRVFVYESYLFFDELISLYDEKNIRSRLFDDDENNLNSEGSVLFEYLWNSSFNSESYKPEWKDIYNTNYERNF